MHLLAQEPPRSGFSRLSSNDFVARRHLLLHTLLRMCPAHSMNLGLLIIVMSLSASFVFQPCRRALHSRRAGREVRALAPAQRQHRGAHLARCRRRYGRQPRGDGLHPRLCGGRPVTPIPQIFCRRPLGQRGRLWSCFSVAALQLDQEWRVPVSVAVVSDQQRQCGWCGGAKICSRTGVGSLCKNWRAARRRQCLMRGRRGTGFQRQGMLGFKRQQDPVGT